MPFEELEGCEDPFDGREDVGVDDYFAGDEVFDFFDGEFWLAGIVSDMAGVFELAAAADCVFYDDNYSCWFGFHANSLYPAG